MVFTDIIEKKKNGLALSQEELDFFITNYVSGEVPDYQVSALLMAIVLKGMSDEETGISGGYRRIQRRVVSFGGRRREGHDRHAGRQLGGPHGLLRRQVA